MFVCLFVLLPASDKASNSNFIQRADPSQELTGGFDVACLAISGKVAPFLRFSIDRRRDRVTLIN